MPKTPEKSYINIFIPASFTLLLCYFWLPLINGTATIFVRDDLFFSIPMKHHLFEALHGNASLFWNPLIYSGFSFYNDLQSGLFYPLSLLFFIDDFPLAMGWYVASHYLLAMLFSWAFLRSIGCSFLTTGTVTLLYALNGYIVSSAGMLNNLQAVIWLPLLLLHLEVILKQRGGRLLPLFPVSLCIGFSAGEPQIFLFTVIVLFLYLFRRIPRLGLKMKESILLSVSAATGSVLLIIPPLLATWEGYRQSVRVIGGVDKEQAASYALMPENSTELLFPLNFHENIAHASTLPFLSKDWPWLFSTYSSGVLLFLALLAPLLVRNRQNIGLTLLALLFYLLCLGDTLPLYEWSHALLPFFRFPVKFYFPFLLCCFALAVITLETVQKPLGVKQKRRIFLFSVFFLAVSGFIALQYSSFSFEYPREYRFGHWFFLLFEIITFCSFLLLQQKKQRRAIGVLFLLLIASDLTTAQQHVNGLADRAILDTPPVILKQFKEQEASSPYRVYATKKGIAEVVHPRTMLELHATYKQFLVPNSAGIWNVEEPYGMAGLEPLGGNLWGIYLEKADMNGYSALLRSGGVRYILDPQLLSRYRKEHRETEKEEDLQLTLRKIEKEYRLRYRGGRLFELNNPLPRLYPVSALTRMQEDNCLKILAEQNWDPYGFACIAPDEKKENGKVYQRSPLERKKAEQILRTVHFSKTGKVEGEISVSEKTFFVHLTTFYPGWKCIIDGKAVPLYRTNLFYQGFFLNAGKHTVSLFYRPTTLDSLWSFALYPFWVLCLFWVFRKLKGKGPFSL